MKALKILLDERKQQLDIFEQNKELGNPNESNYIVLLNEAIKELEKLENKDRLAELEKVILDYYLAKGYQIGIGNWRFYVEINSHYKSKSIQVYFYINNNIKIKDSHVLGSETNTKEMFDEAFKYFSLKKENIC